MVDLVQWLTAQLDADEKVVRDGLCVNCGNPTVPLMSPLGVTGYTHEGGWEGRRCPSRLVGAERAHDPARVLREIDAKRQVLARYERAMENRRAHPDDLASAGALLALHGAVKLLALPYADKPGYQEEWAP